MGGLNQDFPSGRATFQNSRGQISDIDAVISRRNNPVIENVTIVVDEDEMSELARRNEGNHVSIHKNSWPGLSTGDHRAIIVELLFEAEKSKCERQKREPKIDWHNTTQRELYKEQVEIDFNDDRDIEKELETLNRFGDRMETEVKLGCLLERLNSKLLACEN